MAVDVLINLDVPDLDSGIRFYCDGLGLRLGSRLNNIGVELLGAAVPIHLLLAPPGTEPAPDLCVGRDYGRHWTPLHLDFLVEHIEIAVSRALAAGAQQESAIETHGWGRIALMSDPFGHGFCLIEGEGYRPPESRLAGTERCGE